MNEAGNRPTVSPFNRFNENMTLDPKALIPAAARMPMPANLFAGASSMLAARPREVLLFSNVKPNYSRVSVHHRFINCVCLESRGRIFVENRIYDLRPGQSILIFPYQPHYFTFFETEAIVWLFLSFEYDLPDDLAPLRNYPLGFNEACWQMVEKLVEGFDRWRRGGQEKGTEIVARLELLLALSLDMTRRGAPTDLCPAVSAKPLIRRVVQYVSRNIGQPLSIGEIAAHVRMSDSHLRKEFRDAMGLSLGEFIRRTRIQRACGLLHHTELRIGEIAESCGFASPYDFSRAFHKSIGMPPTDYRTATAAQETQNHDPYQPVGQ